MRWMPTRLAAGKSAQVKKQVAKVEHFAAPTKGLSITNAKITGDAMNANVLKNFVLLDDRIRCRPGTRKLAKMGNSPIETLMPYSATPMKMLAATGANVYEATTGTLIQGGFTSADWSWTMFANLSQSKYLVGCNGANGVWSYDGIVMVKETVTANAADPYIVTNKFQIVVSHMNRLFFADDANLVVYYLPVQQKSGEVKALPIGNLFKKGGTIRAMASWTIDSGAGMDDQLVIFTSNGEVAIYSGVDPASDFRLVGIFKFDAPMHKSCVASYGGDCYVMNSTGLYPMSTMIRESDNLKEQDKNIMQGFFRLSRIYSNNPGWGMLLDNDSGHFICNLPRGTLNGYTQFVRKMSDARWTEWANVKSRSWGWLNKVLYCGDDNGNVYEMHANYLNDDGHSIKVDVQLAWQLFGTPAVKHFKMIRAYLTTDGEPRPRVEVKVDYDTRPLQNEPDVTFSIPGSQWDNATWDESTWASEIRDYAQWNGCAGIGRVGAPRLTASIFNAEFELTGFDVIYETGSIMG